MKTEERVVDVGVQDVEGQGESDTSTETSGLEAFVKGLSGCAKETGVGVIWRCERSSGVVETRFRSV